jgi:hypothetical protein
VNPTAIPQVSSRQPQPIHQMHLALGYEFAKFEGRFVSLVTDVRMSRLQRINLLEKDYRNSI